MKPHRAALAVAALALAGGACADEAPEPGASPPATVSPETTTTTVYFLIDSEGRTWLAPERHRVPSADVPQGAVEALVRGDTQDPDHFSPYPRGARVLSVLVSDGTATVDWSAEVLEASVGAAVESLAIQAVVWTLTEFSGVERVRLTVEGRAAGEASNGRVIEDWWGHVGLAGQPFTRAESFEVLEPITVWAPLDGARVEGGSIEVEGEATTFEANVLLRLKDAAGRLVLATSTTAAEGAPGRGAFRTTVSFTSPPAPETWTLEAVETSPEDGRDTFVETRRLRVG